MKTFFKMLLASIIGGALLIFLIFVSIMAIALSGSKEVEVKDNSILHLDLGLTIYEREINNPFENFNPISGSSEKSAGLYEIVKAIDKAAKDDRIKGIYLKPGILMAGSATTKEIRDALAAFKESGKFIISYSEIYSQRALYLASVSDSLFAPAEGTVEWSGLSASIPFYKKFLEKVGVEPQVIRASNNRFKSAVEPFLEYEISDANREQVALLQNSIWKVMRSEVAAARGISEDVVDDIANNLEGFIPSRAAERGLISGTRFEDQVIASLKNMTDIEQDKSLNLIGPSTYLKAPKSKEEKKADKGSIKRDRIAIIFAQGDINSGQGSETSIGSDRIAAAIKKAREDKKVKAIVLRVNSPGGSTLASDIILREAELARAEKPFIVSFGDLAASGGYYISCMADTIVAQPNTITGSIGVFGLFFTGGELLNDKLGIRFDRVKTHEFADLGSIDRPLNNAEKAFMQKYIDQFYGGFLAKVAQGRGLDSLFVDSIGQGRVWTGEHGLELGLVDVYGGLKKAIEIADYKAGLDGNYTLVEYPKQEDPFQQILKELGLDTESKIKKQLGVFYPYYKTLTDLQYRQGAQARMEYDLIFD